MIHFSSDPRHFAYDGKGGTIEVIFKSNEFYPTVNERQFTEIDFVSYLGGTLGLFAGFSVLTAFEVISHLILPLCSKSINRRRLALKRSPEMKAVRATVAFRSSQVAKILAVPSNFCFSYVKNSSLHGVSHAAMENMGGSARIFWLTLFAASIGFCSVLLAESLEKYQQGLVVLSLDDQLQRTENVTVLLDCGAKTHKNLQIFQIPFPAVTITHGVERLSQFDIWMKLPFIFVERSEDSYRKIYPEAEIFEK